MTALISATRSSAGRGGRPTRRGERSLICSTRLERATPSTSATVFTANRRAAATATATALFGSGGHFQGFFEHLGLQGLLAEQPLQLAHLVLERSVIRGRYDFLLGAGRGERALGGQAPPGEELVRRDAVLAGHQAHRHAGPEGLLDEAHLL